MAGGDDLPATEMITGTAATDAAPRTSGLGGGVHVTSVSLTHVAPEQGKAPTKITSDAAAAEVPKKEPRSVKVGWRAPTPMGRTRGLTREMEGLGYWKEKETKMVLEEVPPDVLTATLARPEGEEPVVHITMVLLA